jgi:hypothetical protein
VEVAWYVPATHCAHALPFRNDPALQLYWQLVVVVPTVV